MLPIPLLDVVSLFDGDHAIAEIRDIVAARHGGVFTADDVAAVAERWTRRLPDSPRFAERRPAHRGGDSRPAPPGARRTREARTPGRRGRCGSRSRGFSASDGPGVALDGTALDGIALAGTALDGGEGLAATRDCDLRSPQGATSMRRLRARNCAGSSRRMY